MGRRAREKKRTKITLIACAIILSVAIIGAVLVVCMSPGNERICEICKKDMVTRQRFCDECKDNYTCKNCGNVDMTTQNNLCESCIKKLPKCIECSKSITALTYCDDCYFSKVAENMRCCFLCDSELETSELVVRISENGHAFCCNCDTGFYCEECGGVIEENDDDVVCYVCADLFCMECKEVLTEEENVSKFETIGLCEQCDTGNYCSSCGRVLSVDDDDTLCYLCSEHYCCGCNEVINADEVSYATDTATNGKSKEYCANCDTGKYCEDCKEPVTDNENLCIRCR